jgi:hypothetical protein
VDQALHYPKEVQGVGPERQIMNILLIVGGLGLLTAGFCLGVLVMTLLTMVDPDETPGRVAAPWVGVSRSRQ